MHVLLLILKIIGILLLAILGIILLLALLVLFAPIRYRISAVFPEKSITAKFRWLAGIVSLVIRYPGDEQIYRLRIFGIPINGIMNRIIKDDKQKQNDEKETDEKETDEKQTGENKKNDGIMSEKQPREDVVNNECGESVIEASDNKNSNNKDKKEKNKFGNKLTQIKAFKERIRDGLSAVRNPDNIAVFRIIKGRIILLIKHLKPKKIYANMVIGTGDPCNTGMLFGLISILMALWPGDYTFYPDFDNKVIEGKVYCKGRVRVSVFLYHIIKLMLDDTVMKAWKHTSKGKRRKA